MRRHARAHDSCARCTILGESGHRPRRAELFARNERVVCEFMSAEHGPFLMVLVGATIVGSMATVWRGVVNPGRAATTSEWCYADDRIALKKGEEMGRFLLGSTIIMLFKRGAIAFNNDWVPGRSVLLGERMGNRPT
jgi:phosphatidylserine decarboxylase